ncbi:MAG: hypothetical protein RLZZ502_1210 [Pseudomonadota bacterium]|jgi:alpha-glucosidase
MQVLNNNNWWRGGVIYQIYPRSYADSNGDGCGDLNGITSKLPYVASLGVDAIWLSPVFKSPMKDFGYDVSDYCDIDPLFGTLADFKILVDRAHALGLKVMIDQVLSHTSDQHEWFKQSRVSRVNAKSDWYVWADAKADGSPPNNWLSIFGGSAWTWDTGRRQYYLHNFLPSQPDINYHHPEAVNAILATVKFWLDFGVDGYRLDTANFYFHSQSLKDNPPAQGAATHKLNPYEFQQHLYDKSQPENLAFLKRLRSLVDAYPNTTMVGEIGCDDGVARMAEYTADGDKLHMAYSFDLLGSECSADYLHRVFSRFYSIVGSGWPSWALSNHDVTRLATRWGKDSGNQTYLRTLAALQMSLRGSPCIYQGDELALPEAVVPYEAIQDPVGISMWPENKGRDGCRTPMPWQADASDAGFGSGKTASWLPIEARHLPLAVNVQEGDAHSHLHFYRQLLRWRKGQQALIVGEIDLLPLQGEVLAFVRSHENERVLCAFNLGAQAVSVSAKGSLIDGSGLSGASLSEDTLTLAPYSGAFVRVA